MNIKMAKSDLPLDSRTKPVESSHTLDSHFGLINGRIGAFDKVYLSFTEANLPAQMKSPLVEFWKI